jgi:hypothetical protein
MLVNMEEVLVYSLMGCNGARQYTNIEQTRTAPHRTVATGGQRTLAADWLSRSTSRVCSLYCGHSTLTRSAGTYDRQCDHTAKARAVAHHSDPLGASVGSTARLQRCFGV